MTLIKQLKKGKYMSVPSNQQEAIEKCQDMYDLVKRIQSALSPEFIEEFEKLKENLGEVELFISNTKE
jgi:hypothetical protein